MPLAKLRSTQNGRYQKNFAGFVKLRRQNTKTQCGFTTALRARGDVMPMKYIYSLYSSIAESLVYYSSKRKALTALKEEFAMLEQVAKRRGNYRVKFNDDSTSFSICVGNEELSANITREIVN